MLNIHCFKTFQNFYKIDATAINIIQLANTFWTAQKFNADGCGCVVFIHHQTFFYVTLFDLKKEDFANLNELFFKGLIEHLEKYISLKVDDVNFIKQYCSKLTFFEKSNDNKTNTMLSNIITVIKGLNFWDFQNENQISVKEEYDEFEQFFDKSICEQFLKSIK